MFHVLINNQRGATLVEYGVVVGFIAAVCVAAVTLLGDNTLSLFSKVGW